MEVTTDIKHHMYEVVCFMIYKLTYKQQQGKQSNSKHKTDKINKSINIFKTQELLFIAAGDDCFHYYLNSLSIFSSANPGPTFYLVVLKIYFLRVGNSPYSVGSFYYS